MRIGATVEQICDMIIQRFGADTEVEISQVSDNGDNYYYSSGSKHKERKWEVFWNQGEDPMELMVSTAFESWDGDRYYTAMDLIEMVLAAMYANYEQTKAEIDFIEEYI